MGPRLLPALALALICATGCNRGQGHAPPRASGYVEATEVRVAGEVGGRLLEVLAEEGKRVTTGDVLARVDTSDLLIALRRAQADKDQTTAQLRVVQAGARPEDLRQAAAQTQSAQADVAAAQAELAAATADLQRFEALLQANAGSRKQRDDAVTRQQVAQARVTSAMERVRAAEAGTARLRAGSRAEEIAAARTRVASADVQIAAIEKSLADAVVKSPVTGVVTSKLVDAGETVPPRAPIAVVSDLEHAWANVYVDEPVVPLLKLGQAVTLVTDAGHRVPGTISYISPRAEFTPRNVQTADERSKLVYRIKVAVDNREGVLKPGMPVEAEIVQ
ncbi:MAG: HlyD family efflux transporter periplasmic adaptor subunit [Vicinamibacterales bacterium]